MTPISEIILLPSLLLLSSFSLALQSQPSPSAASLFLIFPWLPSATVYWLVQSQHPRQLGTVPEIYGLEI